MVHAQGKTPMIVWTCSLWKPQGSSRWGHEAYILGLKCW